jgi:hypothetical protein
MAAREPKTILNTDESKIHLEISLGGKFSAKSTGWDENRVFLEGDKLEVAVVNGGWVLIPILSKADSLGIPKSPAT